MTERYRKFITLEKGFEPVRREVFPEIRVLDEREGLVEYVASDATLDSYNEIILANGWRFNDRFESNPVFLNSHSMWDIRDVLGRVVSWQVRDGQLVEVAKWAIDVEANVDAKLGFEMTSKGYLKAVSVGFIPVAWAHRNDDEFTAVADAAGITGGARDKCRLIYTEQQQIELSACVLGANPTALAKALQSGDIKEELGVAAGIIDGAEIEFLEVAGRIIDDPASTPAMRDMARLTLSDHVGRIRHFGKGQGATHPAPSASGGLGAGEHSTRAHRKKTAEALRALAEKTEALTRR